MFVPMVTEYLKRYYFSQVPFSSALMTNIMLLDSGDLNLTIFSFDNFSPSSALIKGKTCICCHVGRWGCLKHVRTPEGEQGILLSNMQEPSVNKEEGFQRTTSMRRTAKLDVPGMHAPRSPLAPVLQLQRVHQVTSGMRPGVTVSPLEL